MRLPVPKSPQDCGRALTLAGIPSPLLQSSSTRASRARPGGPVRDQLKQCGAGLAARSGSSLHDARQNTCMSPRCSTDLITIEIRAPKFLDGKLPNGTRCQGCPNPGAVTSGDRCQRFTRPASQSIYLPGGHPGIYTPGSLPALRKCPYGAINRMNRF